MTVDELPPVHLSPKIDFAILGEHADARRDVAANIAAELGENRGYVNTRYSVLRNQGLLEPIGPSENSGVHQITPRGIAAYRLREHYGTSDYDQLVDERAAGITIKDPQIIDEAADD